MTENDKCSMCGETRDEAEANGAHTIVVSPVTGNIFCSVCVKAVYGAVMATETAMREALDEATAAHKAGIKRNEDGECMCPMHIFERKRVGIEQMAFKASEVFSGTKH